MFLGHTPPIPLKLLYVRDTHRSGIVDSLNLDSKTGKPPVRHVCAQRHKYEETTCDY
jgi:hypothetical protein